MAKQQRFSIAFDFEANMGSVKTTIADLQKTLGGIQLPSNLSSNFEKLFGKLASEMSEFEASTKNGFSNLADTNKAQTQLNKIIKLVNQIEQEARSIKGIDPNKLISKEAQTRTENLTKKLRALQDQQDKKSGLEKEIEKQNQAIKKQEAALTGLIARRKALKDDNTTQGAAKGVQSQQKQKAQAESKVVLDKMSALEGQKGGKSSAEYKSFGQELTRLNGIIKNCDAEIARLTSRINSNKSSISELDGEIGESNSTLKGMRDRLSELQNVDISPEGLLELRKEIAALTGGELDKVPEDLEEIEQAISKINGAEFKELERVLERVATDLNQVDQATDGAKQGMDGVVKSAEGMDRAAQDVENLKNQFLQFFSLTNSVQLFKRAITSAMNTIKELDATMTEAAVVTEFDVGDMWDKLPQYSKEAQKLGVSINSMYQATTLYYQQGLKNNEAMQLGIETMKMGKIAAMDSTDATKAMTAALRGFNMELNETSATRINDVYSQLAAVTAADTNQIATAMEKTASIAASANMEFETTAALLAQIIETTQEAPETAGTAMKTIIARFSEVKSLKEQGQTTGKDEEGEDIDINKIQTALRSVGISMDGFFAGTEGLDSVLLKLAEKWGTLDFETQRYIATMAAGSRQQSRFIAMMSDYARTTELVGEAQNSAGASQRQFEKTQESLASSLTKLKNAWNEFLMGLSNNTILKGAIDTLTFIIEGVNKLIDSISGGNGLVKSIVSLAAVIGSLKIGKNLLSKLLTNVGSTFGKGIINAAVEKGIITKAQKTGEETGEKIVEGTKKGIENPSGQADLFKSYNLLLLKFKSQLPEIKVKINAEDPDIKKTKERLKELDKEMAEASTTGERGTSKWNDMQKEAEGLRESLKRVTGEYQLLGAGMEGIEQKYQDLLASKILEKKITIEQLALMGPEAAARAAAALEAGIEEDKIEELNWAKATENNLRSGGLTAFFTEIGLRMTNKTVANKEAGGIWKVVTAKLAEAVAWVKANSAMLTGIAMVAIYAAAVALLVVGIVKWVQAMKDARGLSEEIDEVAEAAQEFSNQAEEASKNLDELNSKREGLEDMQKTFKNLTKGSSEWRQQLLKINGTVLDLIQKYPELSKYITHTADGAMEISEAGWVELENQQMTQYSKALAGQSAANLYKTQLQEQQAFEDALDKNSQAKLARERFVSSDAGKNAVGLAIGGGGALAGAAAGASIGSAVPLLGTLIGALIGAGIGYVVGYGTTAIIDSANGTLEDKQRKITGGLSDNEFNEFASVAEERGISFSGGSSKEEFHQIYKDLGFEEKYGNFDEIFSHASSLGDAFDELGVSINELEIAQENYASSLLSATIEGDSGLSNSEFREQILEASVDTEETLAEDISALVESKLENSDYVDKDGAPTEKLIAEYAKATGEEEDAIRAKIEEKSLSAKTMVTQVATTQVQDEAAKRMKELEGNLEALSSKLGKNSKEFQEISSGLSTNGRQLDRDQLQNIISTINAETGKNYESIEEITSLNSADATAAVNSYIQKLTGQTLEQLGLSAETFLENWATGSERYAEGDRIAKMLGLDLGVQQINSENYNTIMKNFEQISLEASPQAAKDLAANFKELMPKDADGNVVQEDAEKMAEALSGIDWSSEGSIRGFSDALIELGANIPEDQINKFEQDLIDTANAVERIDLEKFKEVVNKITQATNQAIESGTKTIDKETYDALSDTGKSYFVATKDGYVFLEKEDQKSMAQVLKDERLKNQKVLETQQIEQDYLRGAEANSGIKGQEYIVGTSTYEETTVGATHYLNNETYFDSQSGVLTDEGNKKAVAAYQKVYGVGREEAQRRVNDDNQFTIAETLHRAEIQDGLGYLATDSAWDSLKKIGSNFFANSAGEYDKAQNLQEAYEIYLGQKDLKNNGESYKKFLYEFFGVTDDNIRQFVAGHEGYNFDTKIEGEKIEDITGDDLKKLLFGNSTITQEQAFGIGDFEPEAPTDVLVGEGKTTGYIDIWGYNFVNKNGYTSQEIIDRLISGDIKTAADWGSHNAGEQAEIMSTEELFYLYEDFLGERALSWEQLWSSYKNDSGVADYMLKAIGEQNNYAKTADENYAKLSLKDNQDALAAAFSDLSSEELFAYNANTDATAEIWEKAVEARLVENNLEGLYELLLSGGGEAKQKGETEEEYKKRILQLTYALSEDNKVLKQVMGTFKNFSNVLVSGKRQTEDYQQALTRLATTISLAFGQQMDVTFLQQFPDLVEQMILGGEEGFQAYQQLMREWAKNILQNLPTNNSSKTPEEIVSNIETQLSNLPQGEVRLETVGLSDVLGSFQKIDGQMLYTTKNAQAFQDVMAASDFSIKFNYVWVKDGKIVPEGTDGAEQYIASYDVVKTDTKSIYESNFSPPSGGGSSSKYENSHDKLYNTYEKINSLIREREKLERRYDKILQNRAKTGEELLKNSQDQIAALKEEEALQTYARDQKLQEIRDLRSKNSKYSKYVTGFDETTGVIQIDWEEFNKIRDSEKGSEVDEYLSKLEGLRDQWQEAQDKLDEIADSVDEIRQRGEDEYFSLEDRLKEALVNERQKEIDKLSEINDSINDSNSKILESMQEQIDEYRQTRDNQKTEEELSDKQRRLAYLQQDTSGANAMEILNLQKEIEEGQESYTDQLIDQKISELQKQNDKAAQQREEQIALMEAQLQHYQDSGEVWKDVYELWKGGVDKNGMLMNESRLAKILKESEEFQGLSALGKDKWMNDLAQTIKDAYKYISEGRRAKEGETVEFTNGSSQTLTGTSDKEGNITVGDEVYKGVHQTNTGKWITEETKGEKIEEEQESEWPYNATKPSELREFRSREAIKSLQYGLKELKKRGIIDKEIGEPDGINGPKTQAAMAAFQRKAKEDGHYKGTVDGFAGPLTGKAFAMYGYKTGGLADFTGPAWLDGTKSKPEYILNADQTKAFFTLVDVLGSLQAKPAQSAQNSGDNTYDIDINVESIGSDYDVEQLANTVKRLINDDARYRNNNAISLMR